MSSVPAQQRSVASGCVRPSRTPARHCRSGVFFSLMIAGLASSLPRTLTSGLQQQGVRYGIARQVGALPPVWPLFAAVLGVNPVQRVLASNCSEALTRLRDLTALIDP